MPPVWSGSLTIGLVNIPIRMESAVSSHRIAFRQVHLADMGRVRNVKTCEIDGQKLEAADIGRAYETRDGRLVEITDDELDHMPLPTARAIEVTGFMPLDRVPLEAFDQPYYLEPKDAAARKAYVLMREALARAGKGAVGKYALRGSENLALIHAHDDVLVLERLRWPDEIRPADDAAPQAGAQISDDELAAAQDLIAAIGDTDLATYRDNYATAVEHLIAAKAEHAPPPVAEEKSAPAPVDLMATLQAAADQARAAHSQNNRRQPRRKKKGTNRDKDETIRRNPAP